MLVLGAAPAQAAPETIAGFGEGAGQVKGPEGISLDSSTGHIYVADRSNFRIDKFDSAGAFSLAWGYGVRDGESFALQDCGPEASPPSALCFEGKGFPEGPGVILPGAVAVDSSANVVYVAGNRKVTAFTISGELLFMLGRNVNTTKVAEAGASQAEKNICTVASGDICGAAESGTGPNEFSDNVRSLAVDSFGVVWVGDTERLVSFDSAGTAGAQIDLPGAGVIRSLALDSADNFYVISELQAGVRKLEAGTGALLKTYDDTGFPMSVTLDADGNVYVGDCGGEITEGSCPAYHFKVFNTGGEQTYEFGAGQVIGMPEGNSLAVDESGERLYVASSRSAPDESAVQAFPLPEGGPLIEGQDADDVLSTTATLLARINPEGDETTYHFEYGTSASYGQTTPAKSLPGNFGSEEVEAGLANLIPGTTYHFQLVATSHCNPVEPAEICTVFGGDQSFTTLPAINIISQSATNVTATTAVLHAEMDPLGAEAEAWVEYGTDESYGQIVALANLGDGFEAVERHASVINLQPGTTYHFRFVGRDQREGITYTVPGPDRTFTTQLSGIGFDLPDDRAWEMVSPPDKHGAILALNNETSIQASANGDGLVYSGSLPIERDPEGFREFSTNLARRGPEGAWQSKDLTTPNAKLAPLSSSNGAEYKLFAPDLSEALLEPRSGTPLSPEASQRTPYWRQNSEPPLYRPLVTDKEGFSNVPPGTEFGGESDPTRALSYIRIQTATPDLSHVVLRSDKPLGPGTVSVSGIYKWSDGQLEPVSVLPGSEGGNMVEGRPGSGATSMRHAISDTGSRIFWSRIEGGDPTGLYLRDDQGTTTRLDVLHGGNGGGTARPIFQGASIDGTVVFFTDTHRLTPDASLSGFDLYRCEIPAGDSAAGCASLTNLSAPSGGSGESAEVQGVATALSDDGSLIYFVAKGVLDTDSNGIGDTATSGQPNLYRWQEGDGVRFIGTLSFADASDWGLSPDDADDWGLPGTLLVPALSQSLSAMNSPSGRFLAFMSQRSLTGYDSRDRSGAEPVQEVFRYDAVADRLDCVSCKPSGARPTGRIPGRALVDPLSIWKAQPAAALLPEAFSIYSNGITIYRPRAVSDNGRVFFNAVDSLVPADSNGQWDVYQHEPTGVGDCTTSSGGASISRAAGGCVALISSGTAEEEAGFLDASATGDDAFFLTTAKLSVFDEDEELDVYDARVNGVPATLTPHPECLGEACQPAGQAPNDSTPASAAFKGAGNVIAGRDCRAISRRAGELGSRARVLRRRAAGAASPDLAKQLRIKAKHVLRKAHTLRARAKSCRRAHRRAGS